MAQQGVNVQDLTPEQLLQVKEQLDEELSHLSSSFTQLRSAQSKYTAGIEALDALKTSNAGGEAEAKGKGKEVLVPLTPSVYVPGRIMNRDRVLVDVGTGYFIEQPLASARKTLNGKVLSLRTNLDKLQATMEQKQENVGLVRELLQQKVAARERQRASAAAGGGSRGGAGEG